MTNDVIPGNHVVTVSLPEDLWFRLQKLTELQGRAGAIEDEIREALWAWVELVELADAEPPAGA